MNMVVPCEETKQINYLHERRKNIMKKYLLSILCLISIIVNPCISFPVYAQADNSGIVHRFLDIPFDTSTKVGIDQIILEKTGSIDTDEIDRYVISDFGYDFKMQVDYNENQIGLTRILLSSAQSANVTPEEFHVRLESDLFQFIDMENQLTTLYGEPDTRYFFIVGNQDGKTHKVMFQSGVWDLEQMMNVCDKYQWFWAYTTWNNVILKVWVDWEKPNINGDYLSRIMLYYYPELDKTEGVFAIPIEQYPLTNNN
jgi:hypothetical protein